MKDLLGIYKTKLITIETDSLWTEKHSTTEVQPKAVLILSKVFAEDSIKAMQLNKILSACSLKPNSYNILQLNDKEIVAWHHLKQSHRPSIVILLGIHPIKLGVSALFRLNGINIFDNTKWIPTLSLEELEEAPEAKKTLWQDALKPLFADVN